MMSSVRKKMFTLRLNDEVYDKMKIIAGENNRSMANYIEWLCINCIEDYENNKGVIFLPYKTE